MNIKFGEVIYILTALFIRGVDINDLDNIQIYRRWSGIYDKLFGSNYINKQREAEISMLDLKSGDKILFVGIGTGEDLKMQIYLIWTAKI